MSRGEGMIEHVALSNTSAVVVEPVTGLYDFRNRWYSPTSGSWLSRDPLGYVDSENLYQFTYSDTLTVRDISGSTSGDPDRAKEKARKAMKGTASHVEPKMRSLFKNRIDFGGPLAEVIGNVFGAAKALNMSLNACCPDPEQCKFAIPKGGRGDILPKLSRPSGPLGKPGPKSAQHRRAWKRFQASMDQLVAYTYTPLGGYSLALASGIAESTCRDLVTKVRSSRGCPPGKTVRFGDPGCPPKSGEPDYTVFTADGDSAVGNSGVGGL